MGWNGQIKELPSRRVCSFGWISCPQKTLTQAHVSTPLPAQPFMARTGTGYQQVLAFSASQSQREITRENRNVPCGSLSFPLNICYSSVASSWVTWGMPRGLSKFTEPYLCTVRGTVRRTTVNRVVRKPCPWGSYGLEEKSGLQNYRTGEVVRNTVEENRSRKEEAEGSTAGAKGRGMHFKGMIRDCFTEKATWRWSLERGGAAGPRHMDTQGKSFAERRNSKHKDAECRAPAAPPGERQGGGWCRQTAVHRYEQGPPGASQLTSTHWPFSL